jgi:predicted enzyme related to lactoylglutathione lyase
VQPLQQEALNAAGALRRFALFAVALLAMGAMASPLGPDGAAGRSLPGKFVWLDLATENPASARAFYGAVFGWRFRDAAGVPASYALIENASGKVAGVFRHERPAGATVGARWLALISVSDPQRAASLVRERGGEVLLPPKAFRGRGTHAVFRDPDGAVFGVLASEDGDPPDTPVEDGDLFWLDLFAPDPAKSAAFYAAIAGYQVDVGDVAGRTRTILSTSGIARAGVARMPPGVNRPAWLPYILVDNVPATLERVRRAGGKVVMPPRADLLAGNLAVIADREGGVIGIVNWVGDGAPGATR